MGLHGDGGIFKQGDYHRAEIVISGKRFTKTSKDRKVVAAWLKDMRAQAAQGMPVTTDRQTVGEYLGNWLENTARPHLKTKTFETYDLNLRRVLPHLGHIRLRDLRATHIDAAYAALRAGGLKDRPLSETSVRQAHILLHKAFRDAVRKSILAVNPADAVKPPRPECREIEPFSTEQMQALFAKTAGEPLHALWVVLGTTGLRIGEGLGLQWQDVDWQARQLYVRRSLQYQKGKGLVLTSVKTHRSKRPVPLWEGTLQVLREHYLASGRPDPSVLVFHTSNGTPYDPTNTDRSFKATLKRLGLPPRRQHDLRHTFASFQVASNTNMKVIQELLGHSSFTLTANTYSHVAPALHQEAANKMSAFFSKAEPQKDQAAS